MEDCCFDCKNFKIWDGDPCCLHSNGWQLVLPTERCDNHDQETFKPVLELHERMWNEEKRNFFACYQIRQDLAEEYLKVFPDDRSLITIQENNGE